jgi:protein sidekick
LVHFINQQINLPSRTVRTQITQPPVDTTVLLGLTATLQCKVSSDKNVDFSIEWFRDRQSTPITTNSRTFIEADGTLEIAAVRASDVGIYTCVVNSPAGNESRSAKLNIVELPFAPTNVNAERINEADQRTVKISWTKGFDGNSPILKYIVQRREVLELGKNFLFFLKICMKFILARFSFRLSQRRPGRFPTIYRIG